MTERFKIRVARMEAVLDNDSGNLVKVTFRIDSEAGNLYLPVLVNRDEFDEADLTKVARNALHQTLAKLSQQTEEWTLTEHDLHQLTASKFYSGA